MDPFRPTPLQMSVVWEGLQAQAPSDRAQPAAQRGEAISGEGNGIDSTGELDGLDGQKGGDQNLLI